MRSAVLTSAECARRVSAGEVSPSQPFWSIVVRVVVRDAVRRDLVEEIRFPVEQRIVQASGIASLPERRRGWDGEHDFELGKLAPHIRRYLSVALQVVGLNFIEDAFEPLNVLDAKPPACPGVFGAGFCRVHVSDCALEAHVVCRLS